ncbi:Integrase [Candidatus Burkholderia pumila]|uniref:Integrase n=1 Tax=Candidatus Burkholderia pumila TaxID=1090375 RepID=A0ABR5HMN3_9BURK|nr:Integrase [Candidatus Burkholderia pumila]
MTRQNTESPASLPAAPQQLTRQHFALYRGYLNGVDEAQLHASYGDACADVRSTRRLIAVLRDTFSVLARRARDTDSAHLIRLRPGSIPDAASAESAAPTLEAFRERVDPDGVYSESELLALYCEEFPAGASPSLDRRAARNARLRRRQADALARMEANLVQDPQRDHPVDGWFEPPIAARLAAAGLVTIGDVIAKIEARRHRWYTDVPRLGPTGAQRIVDWIGLHAPALGHSLSRQALVPRRQWTAEMLSESAGNGIDVLAVAPLEALRVPAALDGSKGTNRARFSTFDTDLHAIQAWLDARSASKHTRRAYRREAERLLLWALLERRKPLSSLTEADCAEYVGAFLADPQPAARWIAKGRFERCLSGWRPFAGALSDRSRESARSILTAMCEWLVQAGYLAANPMNGLARASAPPVFDAHGRSLDLEQWWFVLASTEREVYSYVEHRDRMALLLAYSTGLRRTELSAATTDALSIGRLSGVEGPVWRLAVENGRSKDRSVLIAPSAMEMVQENLEMRGLPDALLCPDGTPLLAQARGGQAITPDGIGKLFKRIFMDAGVLLEKSTPGAGRRLAQSSTHWLRHTHSAHALKHGAGLHEVSRGLCHAVLSTTARYLLHEDAGQFLGIEG